METNMCIDRIKELEQELQDKKSDLERAEEAIDLAGQFPPEEVPLHQEEGTWETLKSQREAAIKLD